MQEPPLVLSFVDRAALQREHADNLVHGRAFVPGKPEHPLFARCTLRLTHPDTGDLLEIACEVVMRMEQGPTIGTALQFVDRSPTALAGVEAFVTGAAEAGGHATDASDPALLDEPDEAAAQPPGEESGSRQRVPPSRVARLRGLPIQERLRIARSHVLEDRVQLERLYGSAVWEPLLRNPAITIPEVARMGRKGTLPRPLLDLIVENERWVRNPLVRRALLSNPRLSAESCQRVLRLLPLRELRLVPQQTAYPSTVRQAAQRLLNRS